MATGQNQETGADARFLLRSLEETEQWGRALGERLWPEAVLALVGDLGSGKTTLTQAIARGMGILSPVTSPTFTLAQEYLGTIPLFHFDPYRLESPEELFGFGFDDYFERGAVIVVEWADKVMPLLPDSRLELRLEPFSNSDTARLLSVSPQGERYRTLLSALVAVPAVAAMLRNEESL